MSLEVLDTRPIYTCYQDVICIWIKAANLNLQHIYVGCVQHLSGQNAPHLNPVCDEEMI